jgi:SAM-dependent methyltransferase
LKPEILDSLSDADARGSLQDLIRINRKWGGHSTLRKLLASNAPQGGVFSLLDVGAASGDMGAVVRECYPAATVTSLDYRLSHLSEGEGQKVAGDAFQLPFAKRSFDFVFCSLFLHHFTNDQVVELLRGFAAVARRAVLLIDLERHPVPYYFMAWSRPILGWDPVTVHDGTISVEAGFHVDQLKSLAERAGLRDVRARSWWPAFRIGLSGQV